VPVAVRLLDYALATAGASATGEGGGAVGQLAAVRLAAEAAALRVLTAYFDSCQPPAVIPRVADGEIVNPAPAQNDADLKPAPLKFRNATIYSVSRENCR